MRIDKQLRTAVHVEGGLSWEFVGEPTRTFDGLYYTFEGVDRDGDPLMVRLTPARLVAVERYVYAKHVREHWWEIF